MRLHRLTARRVQTAKPGMHGDGGGLCLAVGDNSKSWVFRWMRAGRARAMGLGAYPAVSLEQARQRAADARMKAKAQHRVPLPPRALDLLALQAGQHARLVFPSPTGKQLTDMALTEYLRGHSAPSDTPGRWATAHGFRSSFRDWASEHGWPRDMAERALAHTLPSKVEAAYHRTDLLDQRRPMMHAWSDHLAGTPTSAKVLQIRAKH